MHNVSSIHRDKSGNIISTIACSQPHPLGNQARDPLGRPYGGPYAGQWEPSSPDAPNNPESRTARVIAAIHQVDREDAKNVTASGKPKVEAIEAVLGMQISYQERDLIWRYLKGDKTPVDVAALQRASQAERIDTRQSLIVGAIRRMDRENKDVWMSNGKPRIEAIELLVGGDVSAAERDAAWQIVSQE